MPNTAHGGPASGKPAGDERPDLIPREFLRTIAIWSIVPMYAIAGAFLGYLADRWLDTFPWMTAIGLLLWGARHVAASELTTYESAPGGGRVARARAAMRSIFP